MSAGVSSLLTAATTTARLAHSDAVSHVRRPNEAAKNRQVSKRALRHHEDRKRWLIDSNSQIGSSKSRVFIPSWNDKYRVSKTGAALSGSTPARDLDARRNPSDSHDSSMGPPKRIPCTSKFASSRYTYGSSGSKR